jgi:hypothetical protein
MLRESKRQLALLFWAGIVVELFNSCVGRSYHVFKKDT